ncbi:hypothetical protein HZZ13_03715 [Bradyrhizobium sp. CNPSo 4010]|uniref:HEAT repeat domain-containing protein n=1 Tax=Bradyrhizobium agreste TaxID=2751811 RepID=A0ABS0PI67_9BRAD|nr:hypothetical protein [Bradyrhizobium agreste]MBH5396899.1 hypothetical protein [Bradyrhizobium agreste]
MLFPFQRRPLEQLAPPWNASKPAVLSQIEAALRADPAGEVHLPDDRDPEEIRWAPGALDALFGRPSSTQSISARTIVTALSALVRRPSDAAYRHFYGIIQRDDAISIVDEMLSVLSTQTMPRDKVAAIAREVARKSPDVSAVKLVLALLGLAGAAEDRNLILTLGRFDELTIFAAVALRNLLENAEDEVWTLAKNVRGWGRIRAIFQLAGTTRADIKAWLLREGWDNSIMIEESAYFCATQGDLLTALRADDPDQPLLDGAGEILHALVNGGPAEDMGHYPDGAEASRLYVRHVAATPSLLRRYRHVKAIFDFAQGEPPSQWSAETRWDIRTNASLYLGRVEWSELVKQSLRSSDQQAFWLACEVGQMIGVDVWPARFERQRAGVSDEWYFLMQSQNVDCIEQVLALARDRLDLAKVGSGPDTSTGLGPIFKDDSAVDFIVQDLKRFPGVGWDVVKVAMRGRTVRCRNMALNALVAWGRDAWPADAEDVLTRALEAEPDDKVRSRIRAVLTGKEAS